MSSKTITCWLLCSLIATMGALLLGCASSPQASPQQSKNTNAAPPVEARAVPSLNGAPSMQPPVEQATTKESARLAPPKPTEIADAVARVFEKTASPVTTDAAGFVVGDFNGDGSEDLAVAVKPNDRMLGDINSELANWLLEDPGKVAIPGTGQTLRPAPSKPVQAAKGDSLLAIIHGSGPQGWRSGDAKQTYLLRNGVGANMTTEPAKKLRESKNKQKLPPIRGDAIRGAIGGRSGLIVWTGAKYAWYSPSGE